MPADPLILSATALRPLIDDPRSMDAAIDVMERAAVDEHRGSVRHADVTDYPGRGVGGTVNPEIHQQTLRLHFAADDRMTAGVHVFATTNSDFEVPNSRYILLLDPETRQLVALVDYTSLSPVRVGACAGVAARHLAPAGARTVAIVGSGIQARMQLRGLQRAVPTLQEARVFSPTAANRERFAQEMAATVGLRVVATESVEDAVRDADVVSLANSSRQPLLELRWVKPGALIVNISGNQTGPEVMTGPRVVSTTWESLAMRQPYAASIQRGEYGPEKVAAEIAAVVCEEAQPRQSPDDVVIYELSRTSIWDVATGYWAYQWAVENSAGTSFSLS